jgi:sugar-specific transcriptional regulator TrmB
MNVQEEINELGKNAIAKLDDPTDVLLFIDMFKNIIQQSLAEAKKEIKKLKMDIGEARNERDADEAALVNFYIDTVLKILNEHFGEKA